MSENIKEKIKKLNQLASALPEAKEKEKREKENLVLQIGQTSITDGTMAGNYTKARLQRCGHAV